MTDRRGFLSMSNEDYQQALRAQKETDRLARSGHQRAERHTAELTELGGLTERPWPGSERTHVPECYWPAYLDDLDAICSGGQPTRMAAERHGERPTAVPAHNPVDPAGSDHRGPLSGGAR
ncbi:hypothetical protein ABIC28_003003 [Rhodococcus sp. PvR044]|uniref:hypothetical protein n=1 Tax=Rhodococcus sp. PvR044 TaxID=3156402 RepID=UPI003399188C